MANKDGRMSGNKGEWSELYAFMKLLSQGRVYAANEKVEKIVEVYYPTATHGPAGGRADKSAGGRSGQTRAAAW